MEKKKSIFKRKSSEEPNTGAQPEGQDVKKVKKKSIFKKSVENKSKSSGLRSGRNANRPSIEKKEGSSIPKENPLLSQAPEGSKSWNAFAGITKITKVSPSDYVSLKDDRKKSDYINFRR